MPNENKWDFEWEFGKKFVVLMEIRINNNRKDFVKVTKIWEENYKKI